MAIVYRAFDTHLDCDVAIKFIRAHNLDQDPSMKTLERFKNEAKKTARLTHPNIVPVTDYGSFQGMPFLVMKYLPGGTLKAALAERLKNGRGPYPFQEAAAILAPIARALDLAHQNGIVHRDMKPSNILLTETGQPILTDFGVAKILVSEDTIDHTGLGVHIGTPEYMAPEQWEGTNISGQTDIYALGVVFYELVTGRVPFKAETLPAIMLKTMRDPLPRPSSFINGIADSAERVLFKALAKDPGDRYAGMGQFAQALEKLSHQPVEPAAPPPPAPDLDQTLVEGVTETAPPVPSAAADTQPVFTPAAGTTTAAVPAPRPMPAPTPARKWLPILIGAVLLIAAGSGGIWYWNNLNRQPAPAAAAATSTPLSAPGDPQPAEPLPQPSGTSPAAPTADAPTEPAAQAASPLLFEILSANILLEDDFETLDPANWERWATAEQVKVLDGSLVIAGNPSSAPAVFHPGDLKPGQAILGKVKLDPDADIQFKTFAENLSNSDYLSWGITGSVQNGLSWMMEGPGSGSSRWKSGALQGNLQLSANNWYYLVLRLLSPTEASVQVCDQNMVDCLEARLAIAETWLDTPVGFQALAVSGTFSMDNFKVVEFAQASSAAATPLPPSAPALISTGDLEGMLQQATLLREASFDTMPIGWFSNADPEIKDGKVTIPEGVWLSSPDQFFNNQGVLTRFQQDDVNACAHNFYSSYDTFQVKWGYELGIRDYAITVISSEIPGVENENDRQVIHQVDWEKWLEPREEWIYSLLYMNGPGDLYIRLWRESDPGEFWEYQVEKDDSYHNRTWRYALGCANGKMVIDSVKQLQFAPAP